MLQIKKESNFQQAIEIVESLPLAQQAILIDIIQNRLKQQQRDEIIQAVKESREAFARGEIHSGTVADLMAELDD